MKRVKNGIPITQEHRDRLQAAKAQTGCGEAWFLKWAKDVPKGLTSTTIYHWMHGNVCEANRDMLDFVLTHWPKMPRRIEVTEALANKLREEEARTGLGPKRLLATMDEAPEGLKPIALTHWKTMQVATAPEKHIEAALAAYRAIPNA